ncbi:MAG: multiheme c-type cytochrome [bacterium]
MRKSLYWLTALCLLVIVPRSFGYVYKKENLIRRHARRLTLTKTVDGLNFNFDSLPGKIEEGDTVNLELTVREAKTGRVIQERPECRVSLAFYYVEDYIPDDGELAGGAGWEKPVSVGRYNSFRWRKTLKYWGDYIIDFRVKGVAATFYLTVAKPLKTGQKAQYMSDKLCLQCHHVQYLSWQESSKAHAFTDLKPGEKFLEKQAAGVDPSRDYSRDPRCLRCHTTGYGEPTGFVSEEKTPDLKNVQCEGCHGPGGEFTQVMRRKYSFAHSEVDDRGHLKFSRHIHSPTGHRYALSAKYMESCREKCHNPDCPLYKPLEGPLKLQVVKGGHRLYGIKFKHWMWKGESRKPHAHNMPAMMAEMSDAGFWGVLAVTLLVIGFRWIRKPDDQYRTFNLFRFGFLKRLMKKRTFQLFAQLPFLLLFILVIVAGLIGDKLSPYNIGPVITWNIWWTLIIVDAALLGRWWCLVCPWDALANIAQKLSLGRVRQKLFTLGLKWPKRLSNLHIASIFFILMTWMELGIGVTNDPVWTSYMAIFIALLAITMAVLYEKKPFCEHVCFVGRISGQYSMAGPLELRRIDDTVCNNCQGKDCYTGNENGYPCPTNQLMANMDTHQYCTLCTECVKSCPNDNIALNLRPPAADLSKGKGRFDEAILALVLFAITSFHGLTMTPAWKELCFWITDATHWGYYPTFSAGLLISVLAPIALYSATALVTYLMIPDKEKTPFSKIYNNLAFPILMITVAYHLGHNLGHFIMEGKNFIRIISDPFGYGWDLFNTFWYTSKPILDMMQTWWVQIGLLLIGQGYATAAGIKSYRKIIGETSFVKALPVIIGYTLLSLFNLWLLTLPMQMRMG